MKKRSRKLALLLAACMLASTLMGCSGGTGVEESTSAGTEAVQPEGQEEGTSDGKEQAQAEGEYETLDIFINESWWPVDTFTGIIPDEIKEAIGVDLNVTVVADDSQLGLMIASNELPDLIFTQKELDRLSRPEACYSYNELLEQYAPDYEFPEIQVSIAKSFSSDDDYYTILGNFNTAEEWAQSPVPAGQMAMYYRQDIYEELGSPKLENLDDLMNVCAMVKEKYPDMIPIATDLYYRLRLINAWMGGSGNEKYQYMDDGSVVFKTDSPVYYDWLKYCNQLARNGYVDAENYASTNIEDTLQIVGNGEAFIYLSYLKPSDLNNVNTRLHGTNSDADFVICAPLGQTSYSTSKGWCGLFVSRSCDNPEAAIRFITYMFSDEGRRLSKWGREGIEWTMDENGMPHWSEEWLSTLNNTEEMNKKYNQFFYFGANAIEDVMADYGTVSEEDMPKWEAYSEGYECYPELQIAAPLPSSDEGVIETKLMDMLDAEEARVIFAEDDEAFESAYQSLQEKAEQIGVDTLNAYMTENVAVVKEEYGF